jgi:Ca2+-binding RTX toxin-like protein
MKKAVASLVAILCLALPGSALAGTASFPLEQSDLGPGIQLQNLHYRAASGEVNRLTVRWDGGSSWHLTDSAGITPGANCVRPNPADTNSVTCTQLPGSTLGGATIKLGDKSDRATVSGHAAAVFGGGGSDVLEGSAFDDTLSAGASAIRNTKAHTKDRLSGNGGNDLIRGSNGSNRIDGGSGHDTISAGRGNDLIKAHDSQVDQVRCGGKVDRARLDTADFLFDRCRGRSRRGRPAATPVELFSSGVFANVVVGCPADALLPRCKGTVKVSHGSDKLGTRRFNLRRGKRVTKNFRLPKEIRDQVGPNGGPRLRVTVRSQSDVDVFTTFTVRLAIPPPGD